MKKIKKPPFLSHYLVLRDLIDGVDVRSKNDSIFYFTSRIENIKLYKILIYYVYYIES